MSATLIRSNVELFYKLLVNLLLFVNEQEKILKYKNISFDEFMDLPLEEKMPVHHRLYEKIELIDRFVDSKSAQVLTNAEINIIQSWKHFERGEFYIYKHLKNHSIFLSQSEPAKAYAVVGITDPLSHKMPVLPILVKAVLLPFNDCIIYDGCFNVYNIHFGPGIRRSITDAYEKAKHRFGLIAQLPMQEEVEIEDDAGNLKFYMKNARNREEYWDDIVNLTSKSKELNNLYYQEMGRVNSRHFSKQLKGLGLVGTWFVMLDNTVIASGKTKEQAYKRAMEIIPKNRMEQLFLFKT